MNIRLLAAVAVITSASFCSAQGIAKPGPVPGPMPPVTVRPPAATPVPARTPTATPAPTPTPAPKTEQFSGAFKFVSYADGILTAAQAANNASVTFARVSGNLAQTLSAAAPGDMLNLKGARIGTDLVLASAVVYTPKPGEDDPAAYVFVGKGQQKIGTDSFTTVNVTKYFQALTFAIPNVKDSSGKPVPAPDMLKVVDALAAGDLAEVNADGAGKTPMIRAIRPYGDVLIAKFSKAVRQAPDAMPPAVPADPKTSSPAAATNKITGVAMLSGDQTVTFTIDPKANNASILADKIARFTEGQIVVVRSSKDDRGAWLTDLRLSPVQALPKPKAATP